MLFFLAYNALYLVPLLLAYFFAYTEGGVGDFLAIDSETILKICLIYFCGMAAFFAGSSSYNFVTWSVKSVSPAIPRPSWHRLIFSDKLLIIVVCVVFLASKVALVPLGVYSTYAFDTDSMTGGLWSFSTFCSETMILSAIIVLFSDAKHRLRLFIVITAINGINLLHGTRIFFISSVMCLALYGYVCGKVTVKRMVVYGPVCFAAVLMLGYAVFLSRSAVSTSGAFSFTKVISPIVYESVFSQISLIEVVRHPSNWELTGHPFNFLLDNFLSVAPRALVPAKDSLLYIYKFSSLSPLGAFSGYAEGIIYLGLLFPLFYFILGLTGSYLYRKSQDGSWWFLLYIFFTSDFLLHIMRDGYLIPIKMFINSVEWILIFIWWRRFLAMATQKPQTLAQQSKT